MSQNQQNILPKFQTLAQEEGFSVALFQKGSEQTHYIAHLIQTKPNCYVGLIKDCAALLEYARMNESIAFFALAPTGEKIKGWGNLTILGRFKELVKNSLFTSLLYQLRKKQLFSNENTVFVELSVQQIEISTGAPVNRGICLRT